MTQLAAACIVLDAGVLIAHLDGDDAFHDWVEELLESHADATYCAPSLTVAECLVRPARLGSVSRAERLLDRLGLERVPLRSDDAVDLAAVRAETGLRMPDAVVVQAAERLRAAIATSDRVLARAARARGLVVFHP